jgi:hypothetical protein
VRARRRELPAWLRQREHVIAKLVAGEGTVSVKDRAIQIFVERDLAALKRRHNHFVPRVKLFFVETKVFERGGAFGVIPSVGEQDSSNVPEDGVNGGHSEILLGHFDFKQFA